MFCFYVYICKEFKNNKMENLEKKLKNGEEVVFDNTTEFENELIDFRSATCSFVNEARNQWANGFKIWFNGTLVHSSKTFKSFDKKLNQLKIDWKLEEVVKLETA